jgi:3-methyladenine DNA glycosylase/8-oxoguanine DNA glycosylase
VFVASAATREVATRGIERMRKALGVDLDLRPFHERFRSDRLIGVAVRRDPGLRIVGRPAPFEALAWAICEQLIDSERAAVIERRLIARFGRRSPETGLCDAPTAGVLAGQPQARLQSLDLSAGRSAALLAAAREGHVPRVGVGADRTDPVGGNRTHVLFRS